MLGPHSANRARLAELVSLVFHYDAAELMTQSETHVTMSRYEARDVLRHLALLILEGTTLDSDRFKAVVTALKDGLDLRGRELFHPLRLALTGRESGPEMKKLLPLIGRDGVLARLNGETA